MNTVIIRRVGDKVHVQSPYNTRFVSAAKTRSGKWSNPEWVFDGRDEQWLRDTCLAVYGTDGVTSVETVTLRVTFVEGYREGHSPVMAAGRVVARATGRDSGAKLGDGVILLKGSFTSGGSVKNWTTVAREGTVVLLRDVPREWADKLVTASDDHITYAIEAEVAAPTFDLEELRREREVLAARMAEIDALLMTSPCAAAS